MNGKIRIQNLIKYTWILMKLIARQRVDFFTNHKLSYSPIAPYTKYVQPIQNLLQIICFFDIRSILNHAEQKSHPGHIDIAPKSHGHSMKLPQMEALLALASSLNLEANCCHILRANSNRKFADAACGNSVSLAQNLCLLHLILSNAQDLS